MSAAAAFPLTVIVPAYNEEALLDGTVRSLRNTLATLGLDAEIVIVNDGSRDRTGLIADALARTDSSLVVCHQQNQGLGGAIRRGAAQARGEYLLPWPADMPVNREDLRPFIDHLGQADVLVGCRRRRAGYNVLMRFNSWLYPRLVVALFGLRLRDVNWIHLYRRDHFQAIPLTQRGIPMLVEILVRLRDRGATFLEIEVEMKPRAGGVASAARLRIMWRTLVGLLAFHRTWTRERAAGGRAAVSPLA